MLNHQNGNTMPCFRNLNSTMPDDKLSDMSLSIIDAYQIFTNVLKTFLNICDMHKLQPIVAYFMEKIKVENENAIVKKSVI